MTNSSDIPVTDPDLHERLCAYVFGELQGEARAAFEAELARSSALRAERQRLEATIGLVRSALPDEGLSAAVRRDVLASARRSRFRFLGGRRLVQLCAAAVLVLGGLAVARFLVPGVETRELVGQLAKHEGPQALGERKKEAVRSARVEVPQSQVQGPEQSSELLDALRSLGYSGGEAASAAAPAAAPGVAPLTRARAEAPPAEADFFQVDLSSTLTQAPDQDPGQATLHYDSAQLTSVGAVLVPPSAPGSSGPVGGPGGPASPGPGQEAFHLGQGAPPGRAGTASAGQVALGLPLQRFAPANEPRRSLDALGYGGAIEEPGLPEELSALGYLDEESSAHGDGADADGVDRDTLARQGEGRLSREQVVEEVERLLAATRVTPGESPRDMFFRYFGDAPFRLALEERVSTFAVDVDTASYALARAYLNRGELPPREAVRTEEFVNYFKADLAAPADGQPFAIALELAPSLFARDARTELLRVGVRARDVADFERKPVALTFVIDNSGSMREGGRLELVKRSLGLLLRQLGSGDSVAVVKFHDQAAIVTPALSATRRGELEALIGALSIEGGTNVEAGLRLGYDLARKDLLRGGVNRVVLCSDGVGNLGETSAEGLLALVKDARAEGIYLNTVGVGMGNLNDAFLERLADEGDGVCHYVDSDAEAKRVFVDGLASALQPVARDVKLQVEFDPAQVESWRLLGYENRALRTQDFRNDAIDAGEVNAGHQVSALYELVRRPSRSGALAIVRLRYKPPFPVDAGRAGQAARAEAETALELERSLSAAAVLPGFAAASDGYQRSVLVAQFAEVLRRSVHARGDSLATLVRESQRLEKVLGDPDFTEFVALLARANPLLDARDREETPRVQVVLDELSRLHYEQALRARHRELARQAGEPGTDDEDPGQEREEAAARESIQRLEAEVRTLLGASQAPATQRELEEIGYGGEEPR